MPPKNPFANAADFMAADDRPETLGVRVLRIAFRDIAWTRVVNDKIRKSGGPPHFALMARSTAADEIWLVAQFPPHIPPLTFRTRIDLKLEKVIAPYEDPFIAML
jgi:hypothetical protein